MLIRERANKAEIPGWRHSFITPHTGPTDDLRFFKDSIKAPKRI